VKQPTPLERTTRGILKYFLRIAQAYQYTQPIVTLFFTLRKSLKKAPIAPSSTISYESYNQ